MSLMRFSTKLARRVSRQSSLTCSTPPNSRIAARLLWNHSSREIFFDLALNVEPQLRAKFLLDGLPSKQGAHQVRYILDAAHGSLLLKWSSRRAQSPKRVVPSLTLRL